MRFTDLIALKQLGIDGESVGRSELRPDVFAKCHALLRFEFSVHTIGTLNSDIQEKVLIYPRRVPVIQRKVSACQKNTVSNNHEI